jgi:hypothetical protein
MTNSIEQAAKIIAGNDNGQNVCDKYDRIVQNREVIDQAIRVRQFFSDGWFRLWRTDVLDSKVSYRDTIAFAKLQWLKTTTN